MLRAHRFAWEVSHGEIPARGDVVHRCGTRLCVGPDHLALRPTEGVSQPTSRELEVLRTYLRHGIKRGSLKMAAVDLGVSYRDVTDRLWRLRT
jgi:hypothetical protein